jgi:hypothetical protein
LLLHDVERRRKRKEEEGRKEGREISFVGWINKIKFLEKKRKEKKRKERKKERRKKINSM